VFQGFYLLSIGWRHKNTPEREHVHVHTCTYFQCSSCLCERFQDYVVTASIAHRCKEGLKMFKIPD